MSGISFDRISEITLSGTLPVVFLQESVGSSMIWRREVSLAAPGMYLVEAASGTGKSSLCSYIYGSRDDYDGTILFNGIDIRTLSRSQWQEIRRRHIAYLPQDLMLFPELTAWQNIKIKADLTGAVADSEIERLLEELGIASRRDYPVGKMSLGQQQRVAIIRAVCQPFDFILLDEPVSHLDEENNRIAAGIIARRAAEYGAAVISTSVGNQLALPDSILYKL